MKIILLLAHIQNFLYCLDLFVIFSEKNCAAAYLFFSVLWEQHVIWNSCWIMMLFQNNVKTQFSHEKVQNQIHEIWWNRNHVTSLLFLDITKVYNWMICNRIMHVLWVKRISEQLAEWVKAFMTNRISILILSDTKIKKKLISTEILQEFSLFLIFYLFYTVKLLKTCNSIRNWLSTSVFINDIILLIYKQITEKNCQIFKNTYNWCMN